MNIEDAKTLVYQGLAEVLGKNHNLLAETLLIGADGALDSMELVELCLALEAMASENGFEFDWTSATAMSTSKSMFRSIEDLAREFARQSEV